ncbi:MAG: site-specific DNA-methyltransferase [Ruminococcus sp.]|nr:site-specific DNA-methyltransferase [Ruminococcus sp.]
MGYVWNSFDEYLSYMEKVFTEVFRVLKNQHYCVIIAGDQTDHSWTVNSNVDKIPLAAYFITMLTKIGFSYLNEVIWDKGGYETLYERTAPCYPFKTMPKKCCEHILIFAKRKTNYKRIPCPYCGEKISGRAGLTIENAKKWRCDNPACPSRIGHKGGSCFSEYSIMVNSHKTEENIIPDEIVDKWHRNIVKIEPVVEHYSKKYYRQRIIPMEIIEMAIRYFSGVDDIILDPFVGIGRTMYAAVKLNRRYVCFERDKQDHKIIFGESDYLKEKFIPKYHWW